MRNAELEPVVCDYTEEDLEDANEWPHFSNIRIIKNHVPSPSENARQYRERNEEIKRIESLLLSSDEQLEELRQQLRATQHDKDHRAFMEVMDSYSEFLEYIKRLNIRLHNLNNPMF